MSEVSPSVGSSRIPLGQECVLNQEISEAIDLSGEVCPLTTIQPSSQADKPLLSF